MTVLLVGVGTDSTNSRPTPPVYPDGRFEYVPIPDAHESVEERRYGNTTLRHREGTLSEFFDRVKPDGEWLSEFDDVPLHYDPNFEALTFGDPVKTRSQLLELDEDDLLAFYAGLVHQGQSTPIHRYVIGYFAVASVVDFERLSGADRERALDRNAANAHVKQYRASGDEDRLSNLAIARGKEPGRLLERAVRISERRANGHYYLAEEWRDVLAPSSTYLGGFKNPIVCDVAPEAFIDLIERETIRPR